MGERETGERGGAGPKARAAGMLPLLPGRPGAAPPRPEPTEFFFSWRSGYSGPGYNQPVFKEEKSPGVEARLRKEVQELIDGMEQMEEAYNYISKTNVALTQKADDAKSDLAVAREQVYELQTQEATLMRTNVALTREADKAKNDLVVAQAKVEELEALVSKASDAKDELGRMQRRYEQKLEDLKTERVEQDEVLYDTERELNALRQEVSTGLEDVKATLNKLLKRKDDSFVTTQVLKDELNTFMTVLEKLRENVTTRSTSKGSTEPGALVGDLSFQPSGERPGSPTL